MATEARQIAPHHVIPIIDIADFDTASAQRKLAIARELREACSKVGFFFVVNHGIARQVVDDAFASARRFFEQPFAAKMAISMAQNSRCFRGYSPVFSELADGKRNWYEIVEFGLDLPPTLPEVIAGKPMHGPNQWPSIPSFRPAIEGYTAHLRGLGFTLMRAMALSLDLDEAYFIGQFFNEPHWVFRIAHYPDRAAVKAAYDSGQAGAPIPQAEIGDFSCSAHTDYGFLTMLTADEKGLEVQMRDGAWMAVDPLPDAFICNIGDTLQFWTNGTYVATPHRVQTSTSRISLPFFFQPNYDTLIRPLEHLKGCGETPYRPLSYGPYAFEKYKAIYPDCAT